MKRKLKVNAGKSKVVVFARREVEVVRLALAIPLGNVSEGNEASEAIDR